MTRCPKCNSPQPHLHPAVQFEGEVHICDDPYHKQVTNQNTLKRIKQVFNAISQHRTDN